jgi:hypothetical protein
MRPAAVRVKMDAFSNNGTSPLTAMQVMPKRYSGTFSAADDLAATAQLIASNGKRRGTYVGGMNPGGWYFIPAPDETNCKNNGLWRWAFENGRFDLFQWLAILCNECPHALAAKGRHRLRFFPSVRQIKYADRSSDFLFIAAPPKDVYYSITDRSLERGAGLAAHEDLRWALISLLRDVPLNHRWHGLWGPGQPYVEALSQEVGGESVLEAALYRPFGDPRFDPDLFLPIDFDLDDGFQDGRPLVEAVRKDWAGRHEAGHQRLVELNGPVLTPTRDEPAAIDIRRPFADRLPPALRQQRVIVARDIFDTWRPLLEEHGLREITDRELLEDLGQMRSRGRPRGGKRGRPKVHATQEDRKKAHAASERRSYRRRKNA